MESNISLPAPPECALNEENSVKVGDIVVISMQDGMNVSGKLAVFDSIKEIIAIHIKGKEKPVKVPLERMQILHLPTPKPWHSANNGGEAGALPALSNFKIIFHDGSEMSGETIGFKEDAKGVYLYPKYSLNKYLYSFVPYHSLKECSVGETALNIPTAANEAEAPEPTEEEEEQDDYLSIPVITNTEALVKAISKQKNISSLRIGEILISENLATEEQIEEALELQKSKKGVPLGEILIEMEVVTTNDIQQSLAKKLGIPFIDLDEYQIEPNAIAAIPFHIAEKHGVIPVHIHEKKVIVAIENPMNWEAIDAVRFHTNSSIETVMSTEDNIKRAISFYYSHPDESSESLEDLTDEYDDNFSADDDDQDDSVDTKGIEDNVVVKLLNKIIMDAQANDTSDIHIEPTPGKGRMLVRFRKDGSLIKYHEVPAQYKNPLISRIKILAKLDISEKRRPQDGKIELKKPNGGKLELRVAILPTVNGQEDVVMRILASGKPLPLEKLALSDINITNLKDAVSKPYGLFLVCGPTGSGKTTTLHSALGYLNTPERKIWTAEDPVEITQAGLRQVQVNPKIGLDFAAAMRAFLRADPDVIMVGEMRDKETVHTGIEASLTGHLVFSTLHTNSAPESIIRLLDMGMDPFNFADALLGILAQRLAKRLCGKCKQSYVPEEEELMGLVKEYAAEFVKENQDNESTEAVYAKIYDEWKEKYSNEEGEISLYKRIGCKHCDNTGYSGRVGLHELLIGTDAVKKDILENAPVSQLTITALNEGMRTLRQDGIEKIIQGITDIKAIRAVCSK